ncbi:double-strand break repair protein AddB [Methyloceanibacter sp.]|uniref:double-strand break repair protein AddB n=1 Tax=Methyloceanibacter sp. TaxID=1965321 RepID=UPI003D6D5342
MPDAGQKRPRLYTIPPSAPFLSTLARAVLNGDLPVPGGAKPDPLTLPRAVIYLPTRRAVRALRDAFLDASGGRAALLPSIRALGDPDEDAAIIFGAEGGADQGFAVAGGARAVGPLERRLALMRLVLAWSETLRKGAIADPSGLGPVPPASTPAQASYLAADLADLMDFIESEEVGLSALQGLVPEEHSEHWQLTVEFLKIVTEHWPAHLRDNGLVSPTARRNALMAFEAERLIANPPAGPVIAAGSTGTVPATARLLKVIASLPNGAVVLPGLDLSLDEASWQSLDDHPEHPQTGMAELLNTLGATRDDVHYVQGSQPNVERRARLKFVSEVLRPAGDTDRWQHFLKEEDASLPLALAGIETLETPTAHDEAEAIALILRSTIEAPGKTAALITPDRTLARRVAVRLKSYDLIIDDSAGVPVARTLPGAFLDLVISAADSGFAAPELMALLKHPLTLAGRAPGDIRKDARALERAAFRDIYIGQGLDGVADAVKAARSEERRRKTVTLPEQETALRLVEDLKRAFAPLAALFQDPSPHPASRVAEAHAAAAEALAKDRTDSSSHLWQGEAGEAMSVLLAELMAEGERVPLKLTDYAPFYRSLLAGRVARPRRPAHPRLFIWGPLEARLQQPDVVILGSLNEGVWPRPQEASPWLSRPMAEALGLPPPERRIGLSAHDFAQAVGAPTIYLSRAVKVDGVPTVPSRWLQRLMALVEAAKATPRIAPEHPWAAWARERDRVASFQPAQPPSPRPPVEARPRKLSVTRIEKWIANPYEIFARDILRLEELKPLGALPDSALRGTMVHRALHEFARTYSDELPADIYAALVDVADEQFATLGGSPRVEAFWRPALQRFARWFAATEPARRDRAVATRTEVKGALDLAAGGGFTLTARADRIDIGEDGGVTIYDYKTGRAPLAKHVDELFAPQLALEAAIAEGGGFEGLGERTVVDLRYIEASGRHQGGVDREAAQSPPGDLAGRALANLSRLIERFADPDTPYEVKRRPGAAFASLYRYDEYEHLARIQEWLTQEPDEEPR